MHVLSIFAFDNHTISQSSLIFIWEHGDQGAIGRSALGRDCAGQVGDGHCSLSILLSNGVVELIGTDLISAPDRRPWLRMPAAL
ncbi:hypothetical protein A9Q95_04485 [Rhodobacterales bacterium 59_46_T64]|nr:hypothetical protein A9Q95_04485 [Rhodobacterales bacterium 59_46_T64]